MTELLLPDAPKVSRDTALELMVHHLQLAHMYFQNVPDDIEAVRAEAHRLFNEQYRMISWCDDGGFGEMRETTFRTDAPEIVSGLLWLDKMQDIYEEMRKDDGDD